MNPLTGGIHPLPTPVDLLRDHDEALALWRSRGIQQKILLHFDAHMDFEWTGTGPAIQSSPDHHSTHLGNYLHEALGEGMFKTWYWIVPSPMWNDAPTRARLWKEFKFTYLTRRGSMTCPENHNRFYSASILDVPVWIGPVEHLPKIEEPAVLNIDADYLFAGELSPWIWPDAFHARISAACPTLMTTLAYSVNGGYTPIAFKFFGQALHGLFSGNGLPEAYQGLKKFFVSGKQDASGILRSVKAEGDFETARLYQKALLELRAGRQDMARLGFTACVDKDPDFASADNSNAWYFFSRGRFHEALKEYQTLAALGDDSLHRLAGEARCLSALNRLEEARFRCLQALERDPAYAPCLLLAGKIEAGRGNPEKAVFFLKQCLETKANPLMARLLLGECYYRMNRLTEAREELRLALGAGGHLPAAYFLLGKTYWKLGYRRKSLEFFAEWARLLWRKHFEA